MVPVNGPSFGCAGGRLRRYPGDTESASIFATVRGRAHNVALLPAGLDPQSEPHIAPERRAPRPLPRGQCRLPTKATAAAVSLRRTGLPGP
jgi:hypothetical protein